MNCGFAVRCDALQVSGFQVPIDPFSIHTLAVAHGLFLQAVGHFIIHTDKGVTQLIRGGAGHAVDFAEALPGATIILLVRGSRTLRGENIDGDQALVDQLPSLLLQLLGGQTGNGQVPVGVLVFPVGDLVETVVGAPDPDDAVL